MFEYMIINNSTNATDNDDDSSWWCRQQRLTYFLTTAINIELIGSTENIQRQEKINVWFWELWHILSHALIEISATGLPHHNYINLRAHIFHNTHFFCFIGIDNRCTGRLLRMISAHNCNSIERIYIEKNGIIIMAHWIEIRNNQRSFCAREMVLWRRVHVSDSMQITLIYSSYSVSAKYHWWRTINMYWTYMCVVYMCNI